jgi:sulfotransferase family protein
MRILLIGGSPSSGSSLLMSHLSKDLRVLCLPETGLFCHGHAFTEDVPATTDDLHHRVPWVETSTKLSQALGGPMGSGGERNKARSPFAILSDHIDHDDTRIVVEKCPENIFAFDAYLSDPSRKAVVTSRDLNSVCRSLTQRGFNMLEALLIWFAHSYESWTTLTKYPLQSFHCRYADLCAGPDSTVTRLLAFVGCDALHRLEHPAAPTSADRGDQIHWLRELANWALEDTAWTLRTTDPIENPGLSGILGTQFDALVGTTMFATPEHSLVAPADLDQALQGGATTVKEQQYAASVLTGAYQSPLTRKLAEVYQPHTLT